MWNASAHWQGLISDWPCMIQVLQQQGTLPPDTDTLSRCYTSRVHCHLIQTHWPGVTPAGYTATWYRHTVLFQVLHQQGTLPPDTDTLCYFRCYTSRVHCHLIQTHWPGVTPAGYTATWYRHTVLFQVLHQQGTLPPDTDTLCYFRCYTSRVHCHLIQTHCVISGVTPAGYTATWYRHTVLFQVLHQQGTLPPDTDTLARCYTSRVHCHLIQTHCVISGVTPAGYTATWYRHTGQVLHQQGTLPPDTDTLCYFRCYTSRVHCHLIQTHCPGVTPAGYTATWYRHTVLFQVLHQQGTLPPDTDTLCYFRCYSSRVHCHLIQTHCVISGVTPAGYTATWYRHTVLFQVLHQQDTLPPDTDTLCYFRCYTSRVHCHLIQTHCVISGVTPAGYTATWYRHTGQVLHQQGTLPPDTDTLCYFRCYTSRVHCHLIQTHWPGVTPAGYTATWYRHTVLFQVLHQQGTLPPDTDTLARCYTSRVHCHLIQTHCYFRCYTSRVHCHLIQTHWPGVTPAGYTATWYRHTVLFQVLHQQGTLPPDTDTLARCYTSRVHCHLIQTHCVISGITPAGYTATWYRHTGQVLHQQGTLPPDTDTLCYFRCYTSRVHCHLIQTHWPGVTPAGYTATWYRHTVQDSQPKTLCIHDNMLEPYLDTITKLVIGT